MSTAAAVVAIVAATSFGLIGPPVAKRLPPQHATWLISVGAIVAALSTLAVLCLLASVWVGQVPDVASQGHWSISVLHDDAPIQPGIGALSLLSALAAGAAVAFVAARQGLAVLAAQAACKGMSTGACDLVVVNGASAGAVAIPGRPGRIVVSRSLLARLSGPERRALLAHERAHLAHGHHWHRSAVSLAIAANPLLTRLRGAITYATERWADEEAAAEVGDRRLLAATVARVALIARRPRGREAQLAGAAHAVPERVAALLNPSPRPRPVLSLLLPAVLLLSVVAALVVEKETEHLFELAGHVYRLSHGQ